MANQLTAYFILFCLVALFASELAGAYLRATHELTCASGVTLAYTDALGNLRHCDDNLNVWERGQ